ncbi:MAG: S-layer homology domain-containing protein, partial [Candidatus Sericytochromatia bacterium]|nr:S-layer homology domain-containing protein [Candidatus Tanganyikabacteria bacterium]
MRSSHAIAVSAGIWGLALGAPVLAQSGGMSSSTPATESASSGPAAEQMVDLAPNHWAYNAIKVLMERYRVVGGFPDKTFRGEKGVSRYELAAALAQIMDKTQSRGEERVAPSDRELVEKLRKEFTGELGQIGVIRAQTGELAKKQEDLAKKTDSLASDVKDLKGWKDGFVMPKIPDKVKGRIDTTLMDDPEDKLFPFWTASARVSLRGKIKENLTGSFSLSGGQSAKQISVSPAIAGADKPQAPDVKLGGTAALTADFPGDFALTTRFGSYGIGGLMDLKGYAGHWGDGIIGVGLVEPSANPTRGGRDMALGLKAGWKGLSLATAVTSQVVSAYTGFDWDWGNVNFIVDTDHDSVNLEKVLAVKNRDRPYSMATSLNFGSEHLGFMVRGGVKGTGNFFGEVYQPYAALQGI